MSNIENITFGVELETVIPDTLNIQVGHYHVGMPVHGAPMFQGRPWSAQADCSISGGRGCEFVSPILQGEAGVLHLLEFVEWLNAVGAKVNSSTGCHVHIGIRPFSPDAKEQARFVKILARLVTRNATALYAQTGTVSREAGRFCRIADANVRKEITRACRKADAPTARVDRYLLLNLQPMRTKGTVEFRCFAGTTNPHKLLAHLLSVFSLVLTAQRRKSLTSWDSKIVLTGTQALDNLLKARPAFDIVGAQIFFTHKKAILAKAFEMAAKYDAARTAPTTPIVPLTSSVA